MKEIEVKILDVDKETIDHNLLSIGAKKRFDGLLKVKYFDTTNNKIKSRGDLVRVRQFGDERVEVCYKTNKRIEDGFKICDEHSLLAKTFDDAIALFNGLGLKVTCEYEKKRSVYILKKDSMNAEIVLDKYPKIPAFIEIETVKPDCVEEIISKLELQDHERCAKSINGLLKEKYPDIKLNGLFFKD